MSKLTRLTLLFSVVLNIVIFGVTLFAIGYNNATIGVESEDINRILISLLAVVIAITASVYLRRLSNSIGGFIGVIVTTAYQYLGRPYDLKTMVIIVFSDELIHCSSRFGQKVVVTP